MCSDVLLRCAACLSALLTPLSCSILEDRTSCPCELVLDLSSPENAVCDSLLVDVWSENGFSYSAYVPRKDYAKPFTVKVPNRLWAAVSVVDAAMSDMYTCGGGLEGGTQIPLGQQCPLAYMYSSRCTTEAEQCSDTVSVRKNYCGVSLSFVTSDLDRYEIRVLGNVCGYSSSGLPVEGEFLFCPAADRPDVCFFRLPRQLDESLQLTLTTSEGGCRIFALGTYIVQSGYDWTLRDLEDLAITIDYAATSVTISVDEWSTTLEYDVVI